MASYSGHVFNCDKSVQSVRLSRSLCLSLSLVKTKGSQIKPELQYHNAQRTENMDRRDARLFEHVHQRCLLTASRLTGVHIASYPMGTGCNFSGSKAAGAYSYSSNTQHISMQCRYQFNLIISHRLTFSATCIYQKKWSQPKNLSAKNFYLLIG